MHNMVFKVFKTIALAIILVFVFDIGMYLYRFTTFNTKMENIMTSMQKVVMENNYLPEEQANLYKQMIYHLAVDYNAPTPADRAAWGYISLDNNIPFHDANNAFILNADWNYSRDAVYPTGSTPIAVIDAGGANIIHQQMGVSGNVGEYGDIKVVQVRFLLAQPMWNFMHSAALNGTGSSGTIIGGNTSGVNQNGAQAVATVREESPVDRIANHFVTEVDYTYYVPCLQYKSITR